jgi:hypothetical protein
MFSNEPYSVVARLHACLQCGKHILSAANLLEAEASLSVDFLVPVGQRNLLNVDCARHKHLEMSQ